MQKIIKEMNDGIVQITTADEGWYVKNVVNKKDKTVETHFVPSVTPLILTKTCQTFLSASAVVML